MNHEERKPFVASHRTAMFGFGRKNDGPAMSIVYYVMDGDDILVSTMSERGKAQSMRDVSCFESRRTERSKRHLATCTRLTTSTGSRTGRARSSRGRDRHRAQPE